MSRRTVTRLVVALVLLVPALAFADSGNCAFASYQSRGWLWMALGAFGFGFLTSLTPCVYPMIPITLSIFGARGDNVSKGRALVLALVYVNGMCLTYATLGIVFALIGKGGAFGTQLGNPWIVFPLVALFLALAASMFGAFELNLPSGLQARLTRVGGKGYGGAFAMGLVGGLIAAPCTGPFLAGLLAFVSTTGNVAGGGALLYVYGLGMGVLFFVLAVFARSLPKSGRWMEYVKSVCGTLLVAVAIYFLLPFLPQIQRAAHPEAWFLGASLAVAVAGVALGAITKSFHGTLGEKLRKAGGVACLVFGATGAWTWHQAPRYPLTYMTDEAAAFATARAQHKGVMVDFGASWCGACHELDRTFGHAEVHTAVTDRFVPLRFDVTADTAANDALKRKYGAQTLPAVIFLDTEGDVLGRVDKEIDPDAMVSLVRAASHGPLAADAQCMR